MLQYARLVLFRQIHARAKCIVAEVNRTRALPSREENIGRLTFS